MVGAPLERLAYGQISTEYELSVRGARFCVWKEDEIVCAHSSRISCMRECVHVNGHRTHVRTPTFFLTLSLSMGAEAQIFNVRKQL